MNGLKSKDWLCLAIGNSRLHWAWFERKRLKLTWNCSHLEQPVGSKLPQAVLPANLPASKLAELRTAQAPAFDAGDVSLPLCLASVVPQQTALWQNYINLRQITLADIPLQGVYAAFGIDRALAVWGAGNISGFPCLVIDAGTALTFTGVDSQQQLVGGAILPGLRSQFQSLKLQTAALPSVSLPHSIPSRWAKDTSQAIASGVIYTVIAGIESFVRDWCQQFPHSNVFLTGGDGNLLWQYLQIQSPEMAETITVDTNLIFWGMKTVILTN